MRTRGSKPRRKYRRSMRSSAPFRGWRRRRRRRAADFYVGLAHRGVVLADYGKQRKLLRSLVASALLEIPRHVSRYSMGYGRTNVLFAVDQSGLATFVVADVALDRPRAYSILHASAVLISRSARSLFPPPPPPPLYSPLRLPPPLLLLRPSAFRAPRAVPCLRPSPPFPTAPRVPPPDTPPRPATADPASLRAIARRLASGAGHVSSSYRGGSSSSCHVSGARNSHRLSHSSRGGGSSSSGREVVNAARDGSVGASGSGESGWSGGSGTCYSNGGTCEGEDPQTTHVEAEERAEQEASPAHHESMPPSGEEATQVPVPPLPLELQKRNGGISPALTVSPTAALPAARLSSCARDPRATRT
ncbi:hypothetical protein CLOM_g16085 [Closterium sp. NIES-68]|nr:hypothetical protein CLOM_g16085 [Closterium sp. NIES-68]